MRSVRRRCRNAPIRGLSGQEAEQLQSGGRNHCSVGESCQRLQRRRNLCTPALQRLKEMPAVLLLPCHFLGVPREQIDASEKILARGSTGSTGRSTRRERQPRRRRAVCGPPQGLVHRSRIHDEAANERLLPVQRRHRRCGARGLGEKRGRCGAGSLGRCGRARCWRGRRRLLCTLCGLWHLRGAEQACVGENASVASKEGEGGGAHRDTFSTGRATFSTGNIFSTGRAILPVVI